MSEEVAEKEFFAIFSFFREESINAKNVIYVNFITKKPKNELLKEKNEEKTFVSKIFVITLHRFLKLKKLFYY